MFWHSWREFLQMGGYAVYVWGSVLICMICIYSEVRAAKKSHTQLCLSLRLELRKQHHENAISHPLGSK
jgi:heme exporter protein D